MIIPPTMGRVLVHIGKNHHIIVTTPTTTKTQGAAAVTTKMARTIPEALIPHHYHENHSAVWMTSKSRCKTCCTVRVSPGSVDWMFRILLHQVVVIIMAVVVTEPMVLRLYRRYKEE
jgi:hypothetical protein